MNEPLDPKRARQGRKGPQVLMVLIGGLVLALIAFWLVGLYGSAIEPDDTIGGTPMEQPVDAEPGDTQLQEPAANQ